MVLRDRRPMLAKQARLAKEAQEKLRLAEEKALKAKERAKETRRAPQATSRVKLRAA